MFIYFINEVSNPVIWNTLSNCKISCDKSVNLHEKQNFKIIKEITQVR